MSMKPSTKIFIGTTLAFCGYYLGNLTDSYHIRRNIEIKSNIEQLRSGDKSAQSLGNHSLSSTGLQTAELIGAGFQGAGIMLFIIGSYQTGKLTEQLLESQSNKPPTQVP